MASKDLDLVVSRAAKNATDALGYVIKREQLEVVVQFVLGHDVFAVLPTGYGKSLCYQCLPKVFNQLHFNNEQHAAIVVVISPLKAIMKDQVTKCNIMGVRAALVCGECDDKEMKRGIHEGKYDIVFFTPESLLCNKRFRKALTSHLYTQRLKGLVIDEAHCVSKWSHTFRTILNRLGEIRSLLPQGVNVMALTATATRLVREEVSRILGLYNPHILALSPCKRNVMYAVNSFVSLEATFTPIVSRLQQERSECPRIIIYGRSFDMCSNIYLFFRSKLGQDFTEPRDAPDLSQFCLVDMYTSLIENSHKENILRLFTTASQLRIVIATVAFGMGVDFPDIREVIHITPPDDVESYIQETGRAGRDQFPSLALLLHGKGSLRNSTRSIQDYINNISSCRRDLLFKDTDNYEHKDLGKKCLCCDVCMKFCNCGVCESEHNMFVFV